MTETKLSNDQEIIKSVSHWLSKVVIGLNLCPFAKAPFNKGQVELIVTHADTDDELVQFLSDRLNRLAETSSEKIETTIIIVADWLQQFDDYNQFLDLADDVIVANELEGILQVASFHPNYQFEGTSPDSPENYSNRSPYPLLHLLREESVERALESEQNADDIVARNIAKLNELGVVGVKALLSQQ